MNRTCSCCGLESTESELHRMDGNFWLGRTEVWVCADPRTCSITVARRAALMRARILAESGHHLRLVRADGI